MKPTSKWLKVAEDYKLHAKDWNNCCTFTEQDAENQYMSETFGHKHFFNYARRNEVGKYNGYAVGKHWQGVMQSYYKEDITDGNFVKAEFLTNTPKEIRDYVMIEDHKTNIEAQYDTLGITHITPPAWFPFRK